MAPAALLASVCAMIALSASAAEPFTAGERRLETTSPTAAARHHGDATLRLIVWYPALAPEAQVAVGPPGSSIFIAGAVARDAEFADLASHPLILLSHGFGGSARQMTWLGAALARHGYVAVAVDHPGANSTDGVSDAGAYAPWAQAGDLRAALNFALDQPELARHIDRRRVGVAGFALGGYGALLAVGARSDFRQFVAFCEGVHADAMCGGQFEYPLDYHRRAQVLARPGLEALAAEESSDLSDPRIRASFLIAPAFVKALVPASLARIRTPVDIVLGGADAVAPAATNGRLAAHLIPGAKLRVLPGVGHYDFLSECGPGGFKAVAPLCAEGEGATRAQTHAVTTAAAIAFFDTALGYR
ncbi:MAG TPA: alpha/beta hydrolase [Caulobacteraceae bacterium]|nr:alpha/beta hydrolase [Caulobacteraceae bacterium]